MGYLEYVELHRCQTYVNKLRWATIDKCSSDCPRQVVMRQQQALARMPEENLNSLSADTFEFLQCVGERYSNECVYQANSLNTHPPPTFYHELNPAILTKIATSICSLNLIGSLSGNQSSVKSGRVISLKKQGNEKQQARDRCVWREVRRRLSASDRALESIAAHPLPPETHQLRPGLSFNNSFNKDSIDKTYLSKELKALPTHSLTVSVWPQILDPSQTGSLTQP